MDTQTNGYKKLDQQVKHPLPSSETAEERLRLYQAEYEALMRKINSKVPNKEPGDKCRLASGGVLTQSEA